MPRNEIHYYEVELIRFVGFAFLWCRRIDFQKQICSCVGCFAGWADLIVIGVYFVGDFKYRQSQSRCLRHELVLLDYLLSLKKLVPEQQPPAVKLVLVATLHSHFHHDSLRLPKGISTKDTWLSDIFLFSWDSQVKRIEL